MSEQLPPPQINIDWMRAQEVKHLRESLATGITPEELAFVKRLGHHIYKDEPRRSSELMAIDPVEEIDAFFDYLDTHPEERALLDAHGRLTYSLTIIRDVGAVQKYVAQGLSEEQAIQRVVQDRDADLQERTQLYNKIFSDDQN